MDLLQTGGDKVPENEKAKACDKECKKEKPYV